MKDIELIVSKEKMEQNRKNQLLKDEVKKLEKKQLFVKNVCIEIVILLISALIVIWLYHFNSQIRTEAIKGCMENGYSYTYCVEHS